MLRLMIQYAQYRDFLRREEGATAIEYGLIAAAIAVIIIAAFGVFGTSFGELFTGITESLTLD